MKKILGQYLNKSTFFQTFVIFIFALIIAWPLLISKVFFQGNDAVTALSVFVYIKESILKFHTLPQWNPFVDTGVPIAGNPISIFYNPLALILYLLFPFYFATKTIYFSSIFLSGIFLNIFLRYFKIHKVLSLTTSMVYMCSGFMIARIVAGHIDWILCYSLIPLFYLVLFFVLEKKNIFWTGVLSLIMTLFIFTSIYVSFYSMLVIASTIFFLILKYLLNRKTKKIIVKQISLLLISLAFTPFFAAVKILPMIEIFKMASRNVDAFSGSQNIISIIYNLFIPSESLFKFLGLSNYLKSSYFWWESFAFVGPLFLIGFLVSIVYWKKLRNERLNLMFFLLVILLSFTLLDNPFNPFHWLFNLFPLLKTFRIPSRIYIFVIPVVLIFSISSINYLYNKIPNLFVKTFIVAIVIINLGATLITFNIYFHTRSFPYLNPASDYLLNYLKITDKSNYYIAQSTFFQNQLPVFIAIENHQKIFNQSTGWGVKNNPQDAYTQADAIVNYTYNDIYPKYFIYPASFFPPRSFNTTIIRENAGEKLYRNSLYTPYAYLTSDLKKIELRNKDDVNIKQVSIGINKIQVIAYSPDNEQYLTLLEDYFPSWNVSIDGKKNELADNRFLTVKTKMGTHLYAFTYFSKLFLIGALISFISITIWLILILRNTMLAFRFKK